MIILQIFSEYIIFLHVKSCMTKHFFSIRHFYPPRDFLASPNLPLSGSWDAPWKSCFFQTSTEKKMFHCCRFPYQSQKDIASARGRLPYQIFSMYFYPSYPTTNKSIYTSLYIHAVGTCFLLWQCVTLTINQRSNRFCSLYSSCLTALAFLISIAIAKTCVTLTSVQIMITWNWIKGILEGGFRYFATFWGDLRLL